MRILYYDCFSGISGDMNLAVMLDLGIEEKYLKNELKKLNIEGWDLQVEKDQRHGIYGTKVTVTQNDDKPVHRNVADINSIINSSMLNKRVKGLSRRIFQVIAEAEAKVHNTTVDKIHFHEVGAIDSIIDIVGAAICFDKLKVEEVIVPVIELGGGFVKCAHGNLPVPAPATTEIVKDMPVSTGGIDFEATTPTGAAILKTVATSFEKSNKFRITHTGYGIGHKENPARPNILRAYIGEYMVNQPEGDHAFLLVECNIDDMNPEWYDNLISCLLEAGASDVFLTQIIMKKGRPGTRVTALSSKASVEAVKEIIFKHTTTLGLRIIPVDKFTLEREFRRVTTRFGEVTVKYGIYNGETVSVKPEYDDCLKISKREKIPLKEVTRLVLESLNT